MTAGPSISTVVRTPNSWPRRAPCAISAALTRAFVGMHPTLIQVPPSASGSITATRAPSRRARIAHEMPPIPPPTTTSSGAYVSSRVTSGQTSSGATRAIVSSTSSRRPCSASRRSTPSASTRYCPTFMSGGE